jgi:TPP-dependent pyruvate/acetoin dehydrogenase alpha subunit
MNDKLADQIDQETLQVIEAAAAFAEAAPNPDISTLTEFVYA